MKPQTQKILVAAAVLAVIGTAAVSLLLPREERVDRTDFLMSTVVDQKLAGRKAEETGQQVVDRLRELEDRLSLYDAGSRDCRDQRGGREKTRWSFPRKPTPCSGVPSPSRRKTAGCSIQPSPR